MSEKAGIKNKTILITGATSGFGLAMAELFAGEGARIIAAARRKERLDELQKKLGKDKVHSLVLDVRDEKAVLETVAKLPRDWRDIDVLVNNAGLALGLGHAPDIEPADWEQMIDTNIKGLTYCTRAVLPGMVERDKGHIVNIGSVAGSYPYAGGNVYGATKAFVKQFSLNLRADLLGKNVRITNIEPGMAETEFSLVRLHGDKARADAVYQGIKPLTAEDVAESVLFCLKQPAHVNINSIELMPTMQAFAGFSVHRKK